MRHLLFAAVLLTLAACRSAEPAVQARPSLIAQESDSEALFIGISPVDENVVWISGTEGTYARTRDGGQTWQPAVVPGADTLQFRDIHAVDAQTAYLLSAGTGASSRIYKTVDGGATWDLQFTNPEPEGFFDCMGFWDADHGIAFSDAVDGAFFVITTDDGGATWNRIPADRLPPADQGEGSFAASGTCLVTVGDQTAYFGTGAAQRARVFKTTDRGATWTMIETPIVSGTSTSGIASLTFRDTRHGAALGGEIGDQETFTDNVAVTDDGGVTWALAGRPSFSGAVYGSAYVPGMPTPTLVAVGPRGLSYSTDNGTTWESLGDVEHWSVSCTSTRTCWATGREGTVTRIEF